MSKNANVPRIRFKGFTNAWELHRLGDIFDYEQPTKYIVRSTDYSDLVNNIPVLTAGKTFILGYTSEKTGIKHASLNLPVIIFDDFTTDSRFITFSFKIKSSAIKILNNKSKRNDFFYNYCVLKNINYVPKNHERHWISIFSKKKVYISTFGAEQQKVGKLIQNFKNLITLQERKLGLYKQIKKYLLQKMFANEQEKVPKIRFKGFTDDWEQNKLGQLLSLLKDGTHGTHKNATNGPLLLSAKNIKNGQLHIFDNDRRISTNDFNQIHKSFHLKSGDILLTIVGTIGEVAILKEPRNITFQRSVAYLRPYQMDMNFLYTLLTGTSFQKELKRRQVISAQPGIYLSDISIIPVVITNNYTEQVKIGKLCVKILNIINYMSSKIKLSKSIKQYLLQNLFC